MDLLKTLLEAKQAHDFASDKIAVAIGYLTGQKDIKTLEFLNTLQKSIEDGTFVHPDTVYRAAEQPQAEALQPNKNADNSTAFDKGVEQLKLPKGAYIRRRADGMYEIRFTVDGIRYSVYGSSQERALQNYRTKRGKLKYCPSEPTPVRKKKEITFYEYLDQWYKTYKAGIITEESLYNIRLYLRVHIKPNIQDMPISQVTTAILQAGLNKIKSTRSRKEAYGVLNGCFECALVDEVIKRNPMLKVGKVKHVTKKGKALSLSSETMLLTNIKTLSDLDRVFIKAALYSGARRGELLRLKWKHVNFADKVLSVPGTKNETSDRDIPLFDNLAAALKELPIGTPDETIFPIGKEYATRLIKKLLPAHKLHDLRHTFATRCLERGVQMKTLQLWLGHSTYEQTANTYSHVLERFNLSEADKINRQSPDNI